MADLKRPDDKHAVEITLSHGLTAEEMVLRAYDGALVIIPPTSAGLELCAFARELAEEAFAPLEPTTAQHHLTVDEFVERAGPLKPRFIHHPRTRELQIAYLAELGFEAERTYLDVPRMRVASSDGYLTSGIGHAQPAHRDTWWSAPKQQIQFWSPIFEMSRYSCMEFFPYYRAAPLANTSEYFNIYKWNATGRKNAAQYRHGEDKRGIPQPTEDFKSPGAVQVVLPVGGMVLFSADQLHATSANTTGKTRFSIDFRIVDVEHVRANLGAPLVDNGSTGTALRDFRRISDGSAFPEDLVALNDSGEIPADGILVFKPETISD
jgi:Phytanoyl-CoA dioxygenase (PhyH)